MDDLASFYRPKRGHKQCPKCHKLYNNNALPLRCTEPHCDGYLGGQKPATKEKDPIALLITSTIASVRHKPGGGHVRVFVDLKENKVFVFCQAQPQLNSAPLNFNSN